MKIFKNMFVLCSMVFVLLVFSGCTINVDTTGVTTSKITLSDHNLPSKTLAELKESGFEVFDNSVSTTINLFKFNEDFNKKYSQFKSIVGSKIDDFDISGSFAGLPFSGVSTIVLTSPTTEDITITFKSNEVIIDEGQTVQEATITTKDLNNSVQVQQFTSSIARIENEINADAKKVYSTIKVYAPQDIIVTIPQETALMSGYSVIEKGQDTITIQREYEDYTEFNAMYNFEMSKFFGLVSTIEMKKTSGLSSGVEITGKFFTANETPLRLIVSSKGSSTHNGNILSGYQYYWDIVENSSIEFSNTSTNWSSIAILLIVVIGLVAVGFMFVKVFKIKRDEM